MHERNLISIPTGSPPERPGNRLGPHHRPPTTMRAPPDTPSSSSAVGCLVRERRAHREAWNRLNPNVAPDTVAFYSRVYRDYISSIYETSHVVYQPDLAVRPHIWVYSPLRLQSIAPPWQWPPFTAEGFGYHILICKFGTSDCRRSMQVLDQELHRRR